MSDEEWGDEGSEQQPTVTYELARVIADYFPDTEHRSDLTLEEGQTVYVFKRDGDYWEGEVNGVSGRFPSQYVRLKKDLPPQITQDAEKMFFGLKK